MTEPSGSAPAAAAETCAQCSRPLAGDDRVASGGRVFCRECYASLRAELQQAIASQSSGINYPAAVVGAVLGGAAGALVWWMFTVLTKLSLGLLALAIGFLVGHGAVYFSGGKRSAGLQALSIGVALVSYVLASYFVNMTFMNQQLASEGDPFRLGFPPPNFDLFMKVLGVSMGWMDAVFLAIVVYEAWSIPRPVSLPRPPAA